MVEDIEGCSLDKRGDEWKRGKKGGKSDGGMEGRESW